MLCNAKDIWCYACLVYCKVIAFDTNLARLQESGFQALKFPVHAHFLDYQSKLGTKNRQQLGTLQESSIAASKYKHGTPNGQSGAGFQLGSVWNSANQLLECNCEIWQLKSKWIPSNSFLKGPGIALDCCSFLRLRQLLGPKINLIAMLSH